MHEADQTKEQLIEKLTKAIADQRKMAEALRRSEEQYRCVVDHIGVGVALISRNMEILTLNNLMKNWFPHIDVAARPICYKVFNNPPTDERCPHCPTWKTLQDGQVREAITKTPVGRDILNYRIVSTPVRDELGRIVAAIEMVEDITESKRMQERLHESETKYRTIFETTAAAALIIEEDTTISLVNQEFEKLSGLPREEIEGRRSWTEFVALGDRGRMLEYHRLRRLDPNAPPRNYEFQHLDRSGQARNALITVTMLPGTTRSVAWILDITDQKRVTEALKQANDYLENVLENSPDPIGIVNKRGEFILWNKMAAELYGYSFEELRGKSCFELYADPVELKQMIDHLRRQGSVRKWEIRMKRKDDSIVFCELSIGLLHDSDHQTLGSVCVARDLSEIRKVLAELRTSCERLRQEVIDRQRAEKELGRYRDHLEDLVRERTEELAQTNNQLTREIEERKRVEEALKAASEKLKFFAYSVAHDLKSPTVGIHGLTRRLHHLYQDRFDDKGRRYCEQILKASEHVAALVDRLNLYIAVKETPLLLETIDLSAMLRIVREEFSSPLRRRRIDWVEPEAGIEFRGDRLSLLRIFRNLVDNSLKYGGEQLSRIAIGHEETENFHILSVNDNGEGLKEVDAELIFRPFQRHTTAKGVEGTGLGLTIVKEIAEQHGGMVWVEKITQNGTTFRFSISKRL